MKSKIVTPRAYSKAVGRRHGRRLLLKNIEQDASKTTTAFGVGFGTARGTPFQGMAAGWAVGIGLAHFARERGIKLSKKTIAEISGRPKLAEVVAKKFERTDPKFAKQIRYWGEIGKKMNKQQREAYTKNALERLQ